MPTRRAVIALFAGSVLSELSLAESMHAAEQEAIAAFLNTLADDASMWKKSLVFAPDTSTTNEAFIGSTPTPQPRLKAEFPEASVAVIADFLRVLATAVPLELPRRLVRQPIRWVIAKRATLARIFEQESLSEAWNLFYKEYPSASGLTRVSRVGLDPQSKQALFYLSLTPRGLGGSGHLILMKRRFGIWHVLASKLAWVS